MRRGGRGGVGIVVLTDGVLWRKEIGKEEELGEERDDDILTT